MKKVSFTRVTSGPMATHGFHRYTVWLDQIFIGEVFQYRFSPSSSLRWMAQRPDGMLHYGAGCLNSRKEAAAMLVDERARRFAKWPGMRGHTVKEGR